MALIDSETNMKIKDVYSFFKPKRNNQNYQIFDYNNYLKRNKQSPAFIRHKYGQGLIRIDEKGSAIWLQSNGEICYRFSPNGQVHKTTTISKINLLFSNFLGCNFELKTKILNKSLTEESEHQSSDKTNCIVYINQLLLVEDEYFYPRPTRSLLDENITYEFFRNPVDNLIYRNTFQPTQYLQQNPFLEQTIRNSIILQYLYYLSNYSKHKFEYLLNWLGKFFKNLQNKSHVVIVLVGEKTSGIEILFEHIIRPLFGEKYCSLINDDTLEETKNLDDLITEKLFYNFANISEQTLKNRAIKKFITKAIKDRTSFAQKLVTLDKAYLPSYLDDDIDYMVLQVPTDIEEDFFLPDWFKRNTKNYATLKVQLKFHISGDLDYFTAILKLLDNTKIPFSIPFDDKNCLLQSLEDKLKTFADAIKEKDENYFEKLKDVNNELYINLKEDFKQNKILQKNIFPSFQALYPEENIISRRRLMTLLRENDNDFFKIDAVLSGSGGVKYFNLNH